MTILIKKKITLDAHSFSLCVVRVANDITCTCCSNFTVSQAVSSSLSANADKAYSTLQQQRFVIKCCIAHKLIIMTDKSFESAIHETAGLWMRNVKSEISLLNPLVEVESHARAKRFHSIFTLSSSFSFHLQKFYGYGTEDRREKGAAATDDDDDLRSAHDYAIAACNWYSNEREVVKWQKKNFLFILSTVDTIRRLVWTRNLIFQITWATEAREESSKDCTKPFVDFFFLFYHTFQPYKHEPKAHLIET